MTDPRQPLVDYCRQMQAVMDALATVGLRGSTFEYPGFIAIDSGEGAVWSFGTANGTWGGDFSRDGNVLGGFTTGLGPEADPTAEAQALYKGFQEAEYED